MPKSPKQKKGEKSMEGKSSAKKKTPKQKLSDSSKSNAVTEDIKNAVIEDERWQCSTVLLVPQTHSLHDFLLQLLVSLPENFTVLTKDDIANAKDKKSQNKSRKGSKTRTSIRSTSKDSKQSGKSKATKSKNKLKKEGVEKTDPLVESSNDEANRSKECLELKKLIIGLRNNDIANLNRSISDNKTDTAESKMKNKDMRTRGSGDEVDNQIKVTEENLINNSENILHRFVILLGFYDPLLPETLNKLNVSMKAIINVRNDIDSNIHTYSNERLSTVTAKSKRKPSVKSKKGSVDGKVSSEYSAFLEKMIAFSSTTEFLEKSKDVVFLNYTIKNNMSKTKEIGLQYNSDMLRIFYKIKDTWNKYKLYTETILVQNIPTPNESLKLDDAKIYCTMVSMVPLECTSIAVILHCILEQITWWNDDKHLSEETDDCLLSNNCTPSDSCYSASKPPGKNKTPILIHHRDEIKYNTFHLDLPEFDFEKISTNICMKSPVFKLWERYPPHPKPVQNWYDFQLQKLQNLSENCIYKQDRLFPIYLNTFLMDVLISKTNQFTNSNHDTISSEIKKVHPIFLSGKEQEVCDSNSILFIKEIIYNILCKVPHFSLCQSYAEVFEVVPYFSEESTQYNPTQYTNRLKNKPSKELSSETLLQKRTLHKQEKLNKLLSFLNCSEFVSLYEEFSTFNFRKTNRLAKYEFIEILNTQSLCQCLQLASQAFSNISYDYFPVTDSILLWFNNSVENQVLSSCSSTGILETPLGFRDFYCHNLRESTDFGHMIEVEVASRKSLKENGDSFVDEFKADLESSTDYHSKVEVNDEMHVRVEATIPKIVYNLGSLWIESTESFNNYFSVDSSSITVKRANYFNNKAHIVVNVNKNNTSIRYELNPENSNHFVQLFIDVHETLNLNCVFKWDIVPEISSIQRKNPEISNDFETGKDRKFKLDCTISITLPSGLFIEVVPTSSIFGPFYVRQRYLGKGPTCSGIWDETYRCYFNNGMVLIFRVDGSIDILNNNGTTVKCQSLELIKPVDLSDADGNKINKNIKDAANGNLNQDGTHTTKESPNNKQKKKGKVKADPSSDVDGKETKKQSQQKKDKVKKEPKVTTENREEKLSLLKEIKEEIPSYKVVQHSVLSWDGEYSQFDTENCPDMKKLLSLRTAFDIINHELYWQRSDGMSGLQAPGNHVIKFPDGSKTTSFTIGNNELWVENDYAIIYNTSGDLVRVEPLNTNSIGVELNKSNEDANHNKNVLASDIPSMDSFGRESIEKKSFVYIEHNFLMEHINYASVEYSNEEHELKLTLPGNCWIIVDEIGRFSFKGNQNERIILFDDSLLFEANVLNSSTLSKSSTTFRFENVDTIPTTFSQTEDSFGNIFSVDERGNTTYLPSVSGEIHDQSSSSFYSTRFPQNTERFFVLNRDLTGYEWIHEAEQENSESIQDVKTVNTPVVKDDDDLYSIYMQAPIYRSKSEEYIIHDVEPVTPSLIKRKDLLKAHKTPETIWFYPNISSAKLTENNEINTSQSEKMLKAMIIVHRMKIKKKGLDVVSFFSKSLTKYMETNEQVYQKYLLYHPEETLKEGDLVECEKNRMNFLGSKSYYLTDNLPVVITGEMAKENESRNDIFSIFSPAVSKVSF